MVDVISISNSESILLAARAASTAAHNSRRGIEVAARGATREEPYTKETAISP